MTRDPEKIVKNREWVVRHRQEAVAKIKAIYPKAGVHELSVRLYNALSRIRHLESASENLRVVLKARTATLFRLRDFLMDSTSVDGRVFTELDARTTLKNMRLALNESDIGREQAQTLGDIAELSKDILVKFAREILKKYGEEETISR